MNKCSHNHKFLAHSGKMLQRASELFKSMGDPTRLEILCLLIEGERQVNDLARCLNYSQSAISHQLRLLRNLHLVKTRREGRNIYYSLDDDHIADLVRVAFAHTDERHGFDGSEVEE